MTVTADDKRRVRIPAQPGARFDVQIISDDKFVLTRLAPVEPPAPKTVLRSENGFTVGDSGQPVNAAALAAALKELP